MQPFTRKHVATVRQRLNEPRSTIIALTGPRQVGKTTIVRQALMGAQSPVVHRTADGLRGSAASWLGDAWQEARERAMQGNGTSVLVIDEVQKISDWSELVKRYWDEDSWSGRDVRVIVSGSSTLLLNDGLRESMAGRFELIRVMPWSYDEMRDAFGWDMLTYAVYGGYPGPAPLLQDENRWMQFMDDSIIEPVVLKDVLQHRRIDKPYVLRDLLHTGARMSGREFSYTKLMGEVEDAGNTSTLVKHLSMLEEVGLLCGLPKYSRSIMKRRSSPKLQVFANAIATACGAPWTRSMPVDAMGRCMESMVGAHLRCAVEGTAYSLSWWRDGNDEVDYVVHSHDTTVAIEVSVASAHHRRGLEAFQARYPDARVMLVGESGIPFDVFLRMPIHTLASLTR